MAIYLLKRILHLFPVLFILSIVVFFIIYLIPGDPASVMLGDGASPEIVEQLREQMGLNTPLYLQYVHWMSDVLHGNLGNSYFMKKSVTETIIERLGPTLSLAILAEIIAVIIAIPVGIFAAVRHGSAADKTVTAFSLFGITVPGFLLSLFLMLIFSVELKWLPVAGYKPLSAGLWEHLRHLILPAVALGVVHSAFLARITRSSMLEILNAGFIKTARSKGVKERSVIYKHALRNAFIPILTIIGQSFGSLIAGATVTETIFNIPGLGQLLVNSVQRRDYAVIQGAVLFVAFLTVMINLLVDLLYAVIDPRIRLNR
ncbi:MULTISPECIES: ABC transporter permease [Paenibacillus]|uniref:ABC transporter permease n=1 Tax=Paenibacillus baimaensis TaxID=2982185 RepID=A0ABT2UI19_9BACL|nr:MULTISPECIES: ABC transporter permease [unclassified Paenibacillus]MCU6794298.1 ABC transporter permease [Paenibacillus sp. WQ 127069]OMF12782.1 peptide ABC transporter [Paenibacillus sp. FSL H7-0331]